MTGQHNGVGVKLWQENNLFLIHIHCALLQDASKAEVGAEVQKNTANSVYKFYRYSATHNSRAQSDGFLFRGQWIHSAISGQQSSWN